jgi:hypothetical protein
MKASSATLLTKRPKATFRILWLWLLIALLFTLEIYSAALLLGPNQFDESGAPCVVGR